MWLCWKLCFACMSSSSSDLVRTMWCRHADVLPYMYMQSMQNVYRLHKAGACAPFYYVWHGQCCRRIWAHGLKLSQFRRRVITPLQGSWHFWVHQRLGFHANALFLYLPCFCIYCRVVPSHLCSISYCEMARCLLCCTHVQLLILGPTAYTCKHCALQTR